jgi:hypothetical protein
LQNQERNTKIPRTHPRLRFIDGINTCEQGINKKLNKKKRKEGVENLQLVEDQNLNSYRVRRSKHLNIHFKFDNELMA